MHKISQESCQKINPLFEQSEIGFPLIRAVIELQQQGELYADDEQSPSVCMIFTRFGFAFLFGDENNRTFNHSIARLIFQDSQLTPSYLLWYKPPLVWQEKLDALPQRLIRKRQRIRFAFQNDQLPAAKEGRGLPPAYKLRKLDEQLFETGILLDLDLPMRFWRSVGDFLQNGFGFCVTQNEQVVGLCYSACVAAKTAEIDIAVLQDHQGLGLGTTLGAAFVEYCLKNNVEPTWDCFAYNKASLKLARRLGFVENTRYSFYSFNRPIYDIQPAQLGF